MGNGFILKREEKIPGAVYDLPANQHSQSGTLEVKPAGTSTVSA